MITSIPPFARYVDRQELVDRARRLEADLRAPQPGPHPYEGVTDPGQTNDAFLRRLDDYSGQTLAEVAESALARENRVKWMGRLSLVVGGLGAVASLGGLFTAAGAILGKSSNPGLALLGAGAAYLGARKMMDVSNGLFEKAEGHQQFKDSLDRWVGFLGEERARAHDEVVRMTEDQLVRDGVEFTEDAVRVGGVWIPRQS